MESSFLSSSTISRIKPVSQIGTLKLAKGNDRAIVTNIIKISRSIAIEGNFALGAIYGMERGKLENSENYLQRVFRPDSEESRYILYD